MTSAAPAAPGPDARLNRERVLRTAIGLADGEGIEAVTIRRLARELDVGTMSLYYHVANKDAILQGILEMVVDQMELPRAGGDWKAALRSASISAHQVLLQHPWATNLLLSGPGLNRARLRHMDAILGCLRAGGFTAEQTDHAYHALDSHIMGFTLWLVGIMAGMSRIGPVDDLSSLFDADALPHLAEHARQHARERDSDEPGEFEFGLDLVLDGLQRMLVAG